MIEKSTDVAPPAGGPAGRSRGITGRARPGETPAPTRRLTAELGNAELPDGGIAVAGIRDANQCKHRLPREMCAYCRRGPMAEAPMGALQKAVKAPPPSVLAAEREHLMSLPPENALDAVLDSPHAAALVKSLPEGDLHLLVNEIGAEDALPLLSMATDEQWSYILDMEAWDGDQIASASSVSWINHLMHADPERLTGSFFDDHLEDMEFFLFKNVQVAMGEMPGWHTFDGEFYFRCIDPPDDTYGKSYVYDREGIITRFLEHLAAQDYSRYLKVMLEASSVVPSESEEEMYRLRNARLAEKGFLPPDEAVGIYQPLRPEDIEQLAGRRHEAKPKVESPFSTWLPMLQAVRRGDVFSDAVSLIHDEETMLRIQEELAGLVNRIISADRLKIRERGDLDAVIGKAKGYIGIGLESACGRDSRIDMTAAASLLERFPLSILFRHGYGLILKLKVQASKWYRRSWPEVRGLAADFWGEYWQGVLEGLLMERPLFYCQYRSGFTHREFCDFEDIRMTRRALTDIMSVDRILYLIRIRSLPDAPDCVYSYKNLLLTLWARDRIGLPAALAPMALSDFGSLLHELWSSGSSTPKVKASIKVSFLVWVARTAGLTFGEVEQKLGGVTDGLFEDIESELGHTSIDHLDPRSIELFLLSA